MPDIDPHPVFAAREFSGDFVGRDEDLAAVREFMVLHGREPIDEELVGLTGLPLARIRQARRSGPVDEQTERA